MWFAILGEGKVSQLEKVMNQVIPANAEICPVLPHPSHDVRRADRLLIQYKEPLFDARETPTSNILLAHEAHPQPSNMSANYRVAIPYAEPTRYIASPKI